MFYYNSVDFCYLLSYFFIRSFRDACSSVEMLKAYMVVKRVWIPAVEYAFDNRSTKSSFRSGTKFPTSGKWIGIWQSLWGPSHYAMFCTCRSYVEDDISDRAKDSKLSAAILVNLRRRLPMNSLLNSHKTKYCYQGSIACLGQLQFHLPLVFMKVQ